MIQNIEEEEKSNVYLPDAKAPSRRADKRRKMQSLVSIEITEELQNGLS